MDSLDDAFAAFLSELPDEPSETPPKRARTSGADDAEVLRKAAYNGDTSEVERILGALSPVDRLLIIDSWDDDDGFAALHLAAMRGHLAVVQALLQRRADVDVASSTGDTPVMYAASAGCMVICKALVRAGADLSLRNRKGKTAEAQAQMNGHRRIQDFLKKHVSEVASDFGQSAASDKAAVLRRAANLAMVEAAIREQREREEEDEFWAGVRARRLVREAETKDERSGGEEGEERIPKVADPWAAAEVAAAALSCLPEKVRPHFRTLRAPAGASESEVRKLYRKLALEHHPDKNPDDPVGAKERFTKVALAYEAVCEYLAIQEPPKTSACIPPPKY